MPGMKDSMRRQASGLFPMDGMERRIFTTMCLAGGLLSLGTIVPLTFIRRLPAATTIAVLAFGALSLGLWLAARRGVHLVRSFILLVLALLDCLWFQDAGSQGSVGMFMFTVVLLVTVLTRRKTRGALLALVLLNGLVLLWLEARFPEWVTEFPSLHARLLDFVTAIPIAVTTCVIILWPVIAGYDRERRRLKASNRILRRSMEENRALRGLLPVCAWCKSIRNDEGEWIQMEHYIRERTRASFTHGICPRCAGELNPE